MPRKLATTVVVALITGLAALTPSALAAAANPEGGLSALSCSAPGDCTAVTGYQDAIGYGEGLMLTETDGHWARGVQAQLPSNAAPNPMPQLGDEPAVELLLGLIPQSSYNDLGVNTVKCSSPGNCSAIGNYRDDANQLHGVFLTESGGHWKRGVEAKLPASANTHGAVGGTVDLTTLDCTSAGNCTAIGSYLTKRGDLAPVVFTQRHGSWSRGVALTLPAKAADALVTLLQSLDCPAAGSCVAAGAAASGANILTPLIATQSGGHWSLSTPQLPANSTTKSGNISTAAFFIGSPLTSVSCPAAGTCTVAGTYTDKRYEQQPLVISQTPTGWAPAVELTLPSTAAADAGKQYAFIEAIDCASATNCSAAGDFTDNDGNQQPLLLNESAGTWSTGIAAQLPAPFATKIGGQTAGFESLSCISAGNCVATGGYSYGNSSGTQTDLVVPETAETWAAGSNLPLPANSAHLQESAGGAVVCLPGSGSGPQVGGADCTLVGGYTDAHGNWQGFATHGVGGVWGPATEMRLPGITRAELSDSLLAALKPSGEKAAIKPIRAAHGYTYHFAAAEKGTLSASWKIRSGRRRLVIAKLLKRVGGAGKYKLKITLTRAGAKALARVKKLTIFSQASFKTASGVQVSRSARFTLHLRDRSSSGSLLNQL